ncbi:MAG: phage tail tape measure protein [Pseudanabaenaceae cyanobacterium bins.68]|nr:phage tail tape measure protein [Pseudanabaenaceae cyanobacterium bins.68]
MAADFGINITADASLAIQALEALERSVSLATKGFELIDFAFQNTIARTQAYQTAVEEVGKRVDYFSDSLTQNFLPALITVGQNLPMAIGVLAEVRNTVIEVGQAFDQFKTKIQEQAKVLNEFGGVDIAPIENVRKKSFELFREYEDATAKIKTLTGDFEDFQKVVKTVATATNNQYSETQLLNSTYDILSANFGKASEAQDVLTNSVKLSKAGFADLNVGVDAITTVLNAYGKSTEEAERIANQLIATQNVGKLTIAQYGSQIGVVAATAAQAGISFEELNAFIAVSTTAGVQLNSVITGLRQAIAAAIAPTSQAKDLAKELGIEFNAAAIKSKGLSGVLQDLSSKGLATQENLQILFGSVEAVSAILPTIGKGAEAFNSALNSISNSAGQLDTALAAVTNTTSGRLNQLQNKFNDSLISIGKGVANFINFTIKDFSKSLDFLANFGGFAVLEKIGEGFAGIGKSLNYLGYQLIYIGSFLTLTTALAPVVAFLTGATNSLSISFDLAAIRAGVLNTVTVTTNFVMGVLSGQITTVGFSLSAATVQANLFNLTQIGLNKTLEFLNAAFKTYVYWQVNIVGWTIDGIALFTKYAAQLSAVRAEMLAAGGASKLLSVGVESLSVVLSYLKAEVLPIVVEAIRYATQNLVSLITALPQLINNLVEIGTILLSKILSFDPGAWFDAFRAGVNTLNQDLPELVENLLDFLNGLLETANNAGQVAEVVEAATVVNTAYSVSTAAATATNVGFSLSLGTATIANASLALAAGVSTSAIAVQSQTALAASNSILLLAGSTVQYTTATLVTSGVLAKLGQLFLNLGKFAAGLLTAFGKFLTVLVNLAAKIGIIVAAFESLRLIFDFSVKAIQGWETETTKALAEAEQSVESYLNRLDDIPQSANLGDFFNTLGAGLDRTNNLIEKGSQIVRNWVNILLGAADGNDKFGASFGLVSFAQIQAQQEFIKVNERLAYYNESLDQGAKLINQYNLATESGIRTLGKNSEASREAITQLQKQIDLYSEQIQALRNVRVEDEEQKRLINIQIGLITNYRTVLQGKIDALRQAANAVLENQTSLEGLNRSYQIATNELELATKKQLALIKERQSGGLIGAREAQDQILQLENQTNLKTIELAKSKIAELQKLKDIDKNNRDKINADILAAEKLIAESEIKISETKIKAIGDREKEAVKEIDTIQKSSLAAATEAEKQRQIMVQQLLNQGVITKQEAESRNLQATQTRINQEIEAEKFKLEALAALPTSSDPEKENERVQKIAESRQKLTDLTLSLLKTEETAQDQVRAAALAALEEEGRRIKLNADQRISANLAVLNSLKAEQELFNSRNSLEEAQANLAKTRLENQIKIAQAVGDEVTAQRLKLESYAQELASQERIFAAQRKTLEISQQIKAAELERQKILDQIAVKESEIGEAKLRQKKDVTEGELALARDLVRLNQEKLKATEQAILRQGEINQIAREELNIKQTTTAESEKVRRVEEAIKLISEGKLEVTDQLLAQLGLVGNSIQAQAGATRAWSGEMRLANGEVFKIGDSLVEVGTKITQQINTTRSWSGEITLANGEVIKVGESFKAVGSEISDINRMLIESIRRAEELGRKNKQAADQLKNRVNPNGFVGDPKDDPFNGAGSFGGTTADYLEFFLQGGQVGFGDTDPKDLARAAYDLLGKSEIDKLIGVTPDRNTALQLLTSKFSGQATAFDPGGGFANGGLITGRGTGTSDSILARLSNGEFVVNAKATQNYRPLLEAINGMRLPKFNSGGFVGVDNLNSVPVGERDAVKAALRLIPGGKIVRDSSGRISVSSQSANDFNRFLNVGMPTLSEQVGKTEESFKRIADTTSRAVSVVSQAVNNNRLNAPINNRALEQKIKIATSPGAIAASPVGNNTINIVNRPEPERDLRNALIELGRRR